MCSLIKRCTLEIDRLIAGHYGRERHTGRREKNEEATE